MKNRTAMGVVLSPETYVSYGSRLNNAQTFIANNNDSATHERLWFMLGKSNTYLVCKFTISFKYKEYFDSGLLIDLTQDNSVKSVHSLHSKICALLFSRTEYVHQCNRIRNQLASNVTPGFRWNGCEWESIVNKYIVSNAGYMTGLFDNGIYWDMKGTFKFVPPSVGNEPFILEALSKCDSYEPGQAKLFALMFGFVANRDIIYIGSAPGEGWQHALNALNKNINVYSFDPRDIVSVEKRVFNLHHYAMCIKSPEDLWDVIPPGIYDFIWDVRCETSTMYSSSGASCTTLIRNAIASEVVLLNRIMSSPRWKEISRATLKVKIELINHYMLPDNTRLFPMPYTKRDNKFIHELRAVFRNRTDSVYIKQPLLSPLAIMSAFSAIERLGNALDETLFLNSMLLRYDYENFIHVSDHRDVSVDINLFCLNRNTALEISQYMDFIDTSKRPMISSFFIGSQLQENEIPIDEIDLVRREYMVFDSRAIIPRKLSKLYFFSNELNIKWYNNELTFAETYVIMNTEMTIRIDDKIEAYDIIRNEVCAESGQTFYKFPNVFSIGDEVSSPSGHAVRMLYMYLQNEVSLAMFIYKIVYSFAQVRMSWVKINRKPIVDKELHGLPLNIVSGCGEIKVHCLWHSYDEWILGMKVAFRLLGKPYPASITSLMDKVINAKDKLGKEIKGQYALIGYDKDKYSQVRNRVMKNISIDNTTISTFVDEMAVRDSSDMIALFVENVSHNPTWIKSVALLRIDAVLRDYTIHISYFRVVGQGRYPSHDSSKITKEEAYHNAAFQVTKDPRYIRMHYANNAHHPQHHMDEDEILGYIPDENLEEMAIDLASRKWQLEMPFRREVYGFELHNVDKFINYAGFPRARFRLIMLKMVPSRTTFSIENVRSEHCKICRNFYG